MKKKRILSVLLSGVLLCAGFPAGAGSRALAADLGEGYDKEAHIQLSRRAAAEGMVLLKNDGDALPIAPGGGVALFGPGQIDFIKGGWGSGDVKVEYIRNLLDGMEIKDSEGKIQLNEDLAQRYRTDKNFNLSSEIAREAAAQSSTAVVVISRNSGEGYDRNTGEGDYYLNSSEKNMLSAVCNAGFAHVVVVLNIGGVIDTSWLEQFPAVDAVLVAWQPGMEGGLAAADILCGDVNPSGKLTDTFAKSYADYPSSEGFFEDDFYVDYTEDIYVGYRYFETFDPTYSRVNYEFGFGLSYTDFSIDNVQAAVDGENIRVTADVTNTGDVAGKEVVQVYFSAPQGKLGKPAKELAAFQKTKLLEPGETETVEMTYAIADMSSYDDLGKVQESAYVLEAGDYAVYVGNSVKDAGRRGVRFTYTVEEDTIVEQLSEQVAPIQLEERLINDGSGEEKYEALPMPDDYAYDLSGGDILIQAEKYYKKQVHVALQFDEAATNGGMYIQSSDQGDRWLCYAVKAPRAGTYAVTLGLGNGGNVSRNGLMLYVDDAKQTLPRVTLPSTGGQFAIQDVGSFSVQLHEGINFLTISFTDSSFTGVLDTVRIEEGEGDYVEETIDPHPVSASGETRIEAEDYTGVEGNKDIGPEDAIVNGEKIGVSVKALDTEGAVLEYSLQVEKAGEYNMMLHVSSGSGDKNDCMDVLVNGEKQEGILCNIPQTSVEGNQWFNFIDVGPFAIDLPAGEVTLRFEFKNFGNFDAFTLTPTADAPEEAAHAVAASGETRIEAEEYAAVEGNPDIGPEDAIVNGEKIGVSVKALDTEGAVLEYSLQVEKAGKYNLTMHASSGSGDKNDCLDVLVNGVKQEGIVCNIPHTGIEGNQWFNFIDVGPFAIDLPAGEVTLRFEFKNFGNFDAFTLEPISENTALRTAAAAALPVAEEETDIITFQEVYENPELLDAFIAQLSAEDIVSMTHGHGSVIPDGTGSIGYLPDYGVPGVETTDGPAGIRQATNTTAFPIATLLACSWDPALLEEVGAAAGEEAKSFGAFIWLAPALNIHRNPMTGRNFEYYSEDPLVSGKMAAAITRGTQSQGVAVTIKHFAANNKETQRGYSDSRMSERALREIYLKGFEICIDEADPWCLMSSYNSINGVETSENPELLTNILRGEWDYQGMVMTDWWNDSVTCWEIKAGNEVRMASAENPLHVYDAYRAGWITREELDRTAKRILEMILKTDAMEYTAASAKWHTVTAAGSTRIKATDYSWKSDGIAVEICEDEDGGTNPKNTYANEWLRYNIQVERPGDYTFKVRYASPGGGSSLDILVDGETVGHFDRFDGTGGWQAWATSAPITFHLEKGEHDLRVNILADGANVNWFELERIQPNLEVSISPTEAAVEPGGTLELTAEVSGTEATGREEVVWSVSGGGAGTSIDQNGRLTAASDERAESLTVTAAIEGTDISDSIVVHVTPAEIPTEKGDVNGDGTVDIQDVMAACKILARANAGALPTDEEIARADVAEDGLIDIQDVMGICRILARQTASAR